MKKEELKKTAEEKQIELIDKAINELVYEKTKFIKAYNYYHGKRDPEQFRHLEENYGIGTPSSVEFVPLVRKHVDVLVGEYLSTPITPKISCKDSKTISLIQRDKHNAIIKGLFEEYKKYLNNAVYSALNGNQNVTDPSIEKKLLDLKDSIENGFISDYEIAAQNIVDYIMQARGLDFKNKRKQLLLDLLIVGAFYFQVVPSASKTGINIRVLNPINTFIDRNPESPYFNESSRSVIRNFYTKEQILLKYGEYLTDEELADLDSMESYQFESNAVYLRSTNNTISNPDDNESDGILGGFEVTTVLPGNHKYYRQYPVYEVEYLQADEEDGKFILNRYSGVRIGTHIHIVFGKDDVIRSMDDPRNCKLTVNGMFQTDRNGDPFSLLLSTADLQDKFDCLNFFRDNIIAESGSVGDWLDVAHLPKFLGANVTERLLKWKAYKKSGLALYDSSQEGEVVNTSFSGFDDTIKLQTIQAIDLAIQRVEETTSTITGVFREKLGGIEQRDAVTNVQVGVTQSTYITKQYYYNMDLATREILIDSLNVAKKVYKNGISGTIILGEKLNKVFTALPEHYSFTDHDIHIADSSEIVREQETIKQLTAELSKNGMTPPEVLIEIVTASGLTKMKRDVLQALKTQKEENGQLSQLSSQLEQLNQQLKELSKENETLKRGLNKSDSQKIQLEREKFENEKDLEWFKARKEVEKDEREADSEEMRVKLEGLQLLDNNPRNDEVRNE